MAVEVGAALYDPTNTTLVASLDGADRRQWRAQKNDKGAGSLVLALDDADRAAMLAVRNRIVRFGLDGTDVWAGVVRRPRVTLRASAEEAGEQAEYPIFGLLSVFDDVRVEPELGVGVVSPKTRRFDHSSKYFDDSLWDAAWEIKRQGDNSGQWDGAPGGWQDPDASWVWCRAQSGGSPPQPVGRFPWRLAFTLAEEQLVILRFTADDGRTMILDAEIVDADLAEFAWGNTYEVRRFLSAGDHVLAGWAENMPRDLAATNVAGLLFAAHATTDGGKTVGDVLFHSDDTVKVLDYPASAPALTPGHMVRVLVEEAQARGMLTGLSLDFDDDLDSDGNAWADPVDLVVQVGDSYANVLKQLIETSVDVAMTPTGLTLQMWNKGGLGTVTAVSYTLDVDIASASFDGEDASGTAMLTQDERGVWQWREASTIGDGRVETSAELGAAPSESSADTVAQAVFADIGVPRDHGQFGVEASAGQVPLVDFIPGDVVTVVDVDGAAQQAVADAVTVSEDDNGFAVFTLEAVVT